MAIPQGKVFDPETMALIDAPPAKEKTADTTAVKTEDEPIEEEAPDPDAKPKEEEPKEEEPKEEEPKEEEPGEKEKEPEVVNQGVDDFIKEKYSEKLGVETEDALDEKLEELIQLSTEHEALKAELAELKASEGKPKFSSKQEEKAYEFLKEFDVTRMSEGMQTLARIVTMDLEHAEPRIMLEEKFIIEHPELTREESLRKFSKDYAKKFTVKKEDFESEEAYKEELEDVKIEEKSAVAKAKDFLAKKQKEFKAAPKEESVEAKTSPVVQTSIQKNVAALDGYIKDFNSITYAPTKDEKDNFTIKFTKEQLKTIHEATKGWVRDSNAYDDKGEIKGGFDPEKNVIKVTYLLYGEDILAKMYAHVMSQADIKRAEQIATKKPDREAKTAIDKVAGGSEEKQWDDMIRRKKTQRSKQTQY